MLMNIFLYRCIIVLVIVNCVFKNLKKQKKNKRLVMLFSDQDIGYIFGFCLCISIKEIGREGEMMYCSSVDEFMI